MAANNGHLKIVECLVNHSANINIQNSTLALEINQ